MAMFTFRDSTPPGEVRRLDKIKYGEFSSKEYPPKLFEDVKEWLLDADAVPTEWDKLLNLREQAE